MTVEKEKVNNAVQYFNNFKFNNLYYKPEMEEHLQILKEYIKLLESNVNFLKRKFYHPKFPKGSTVSTDRGNGTVIGYGSNNELVVDINGISYLYLESMLK